VNRTFLSVPRTVTQTKGPLAVPFAFSAGSQIFRQSTLYGPRCFGLLFKLWQVSSINDIVPLPRRRWLGANGDRRLSFCCSYNALPSVNTQLRFAFLFPRGHIEATPSLKHESFPQLTFETFF